MANPEIILICWLLCIYSIAVICLIFRMQLILYFLYFPSLTYRNWCSECCMHSFVSWNFKAMIREPNPRLSRSQRRMRSLPMPLMVRLRATKMQVWWTSQWRQIQMLRCHWQKSHRLSSRHQTRQLLMACRCKRVLKRARRLCRFLPTKHPTRLSYKYRPPVRTLVCRLLELSWIHRQRRRRTKTRPTVWIRTALLKTNLELTRLPRLSSTKRKHWTMHNLPMA